MKIYLATWLVETSQGNTLTKMNQKKRLVSYYLLTDQKITKTNFRNYIETGLSNQK